MKTKIEKDIPQLSICIPSYNGGKVLLSCVNNILTYSGNEIEIVVNDNASSSEEAKRAIEYLKLIQDARLRIYVNEKNEGPFKNWYLALKRGTGHYLMLLQDNNELVVENLPQYLEFLKDCNYSIIKNAYHNREGIQGEIRTSQMQYYSKIFSHASMCVYKKTEFHSFVPDERSFSYEMCCYPYFVWDTQILSRYSIRDKRSTVNNSIEIYRATKHFMLSRTRNYVINESIPPSYTYANAEYMFDKHKEFIRELYRKDRDYFLLVSNLYRGDLFWGTIGYYENVNNPETRERYHIPKAKIDGVKLSFQFYKHIMCDEFNKKWNRKLLLLVITCQNALNFKLNFVYERTLRNLKYLCGCILNKVLLKLIRLTT